ncbi:hypothetical protein A2258_01755 [Candidatus Uhrbacteria bacterium RIFOXYA2_FULL_41_8]|nr:MAG: hypothetical protein A2258_01755 [Candidatus Uhrbacteria bacterium RIFOXYA2_FULL_41_8]
MFEMMTYRTKRILGIITLIAVTILMGALLYFAFTAAPMIQQEPTIPTDEGAAGGLIGAPEAGERTPVQDQTSGALQPSPVAIGGPTFTQRLTATVVTSPTLIEGTGIAFYNNQDGRFYKIDESGELIALSSAAFPKAESVVFADTADIAVIEFPDGTNIIYNFLTDQQTTLPSHWEEFDFSSDGENVVSKSMASDSSQNTLVSSSSDGSRTEVLTPLGTNTDKVTVNYSTNNSIVGFSQTGASSLGFGRYEIYLIGSDGEESGNLIVEGGNFAASWSPTSTYLLYSVAWSANNDRPSLWVSSGTGDVGSNRMNLGVETWVEKCTFKNDLSIICAVPDEATDASGLDHRLITATDSLYEINLKTGTKKLLGYPTLDMQMFNLSVSDDDSILYFLDAYGRLNFMNLK